MITIKIITVISKNSNIITELTNKINTINSGKNYVEIIEEDIDLLVSLLENIINNYCQKPLISRLISRYYPYYSKEETAEILKKISFNTDNTQGFFYKSAKEIVKLELTEYLKNNNVINLEGFVNFRLNNYIEILVDIISVSVEEFIIEKEYDEFISLMKSYVSLQRFQYKRIEVLLFNDNFLLFDEFSNDITAVCISKCFGQDLDIILQPEDMLLNILITTAPKEIIIYNKNSKYSELISTLRKIFENKLKVIENEIIKTDFSN